jgi:cobalt/nickel transport system permease protein
MHIHYLDPYTERESPIHSLDPRVKLLLTLAFIITCSVTPVGTWAIFVLLVAISLSTIIVSEIGVGRVFKRSLLALPFVLAALPLLFTSGGNAVLNIPVGSAELTVYGPGLERFLSIALKSWLSVQMAIVLATTTPFPDLLLAMRGIRIPKLLVAIFGLMWRYLFVMADEAGRLLRAREARSGVPALDDSRQTSDYGRPAASGQRSKRRKPGGSIIWRARITGGMAGNLLVRSMARGDRIYDAMRARGYDGDIRLLSAPRIGTSDWVVLAGGLLVMAALLALAFIIQI